DVLAFGEVGLVAARRKADGKPAGLKTGPTVAPRSQGKGLVLIDLMRTQAGMVALAGAMVPHHPFPPGIERNGAPRLNIGADGFVDPASACRLDRASGTLAINAPPAGIVSVGGYRFALKELQDFIAALADGSTLAALPDALAGHRLAGVANDRHAV